MSFSIVSGIGLDDAERSLGVLGAKYPNNSALKLTVDTLKGYLSIFPNEDIKTGT